MQPGVENHPHILSPNGATAGIITILSIGILPHLEMKSHTVTARNCGMVQIFRRKNSPDADFQLKLSGLIPDAIYETEFFSGEKKRLSGRELASLTIHLDSPRSFQILRCKLIKSA